MEKNEHIKQLYKKYLDNSIGVEEKESLFHFFQNSTQEEINQVVDEYLDDPNYPSDLSFLYEEIDEQLVKIKEKIYSIEESRRDRKIQMKAYIAIAATVLITFCIGLFIYQQKQNFLNDSSLINIEPGGNKATLTLADGKTIKLSDSQSGIIIGDKDINYADGSSVGEKDFSPTLQQANTLTLTTPKGGQYQVTLPDGTKVWLNAASTLKYPSRFSGEERRVVFSGEAYFEVAKNTKQPFIVTSDEQEIQVLGTQFNINTFKDEGAVLTTLVEGSVQVPTLSQTLSSSPALSSRGTKDLYKPSLPTILTPGQQASLASNGNLNLKTVDTKEFTAWKDNVLFINQKSLKSILLALSRWYDFKVDVSQIPDVVLSGIIPRNVNLSEVLEMLQESSNLKIKIIRTGMYGGERRVIIEP